jgi:hypothetical protein
MTVPAGGCDRPSPSREKRGCTGMEAFAVPASGMPEPPGDVVQPTVELSMCGAVDCKCFLRKKSVICRELNKKS